MNVYRTVLGTFRFSPLPEGWWSRTRSSSVLLWSRWRILQKRIC